MEKEIVKLLKQHSRSFKNLKDLFNVTSNQLNDLLLKLQEEGLVVSKKQEYFVPEDLELKRAKITKIKDCFSLAIIDGEEEEVIIENRNLNSALKDDEVFLEEDYQSNKEAYKVFSIIKRAHLTLVGEIFQKNGYYYLQVNDRSYQNFKINIVKTEIPLIEGQIVRATILDSSRNSIACAIEEVIGSRNDPGIDVLRIILEHGAPTTFKDEVKEEVKKLPREVASEDKKNREDFTNHFIVTIDGEDAKDFDDAVEAYEDDEGFHVGVHIADVAHYVKQFGSIDKEALSRATSLYATDRVVPMLPFELSNGICSLNPGVERLVTSCFFVVDKDGNVSNTRICKGVIKSKARLTYTYVNAVLKHQIKEKNHELEQALYTLNKAACSLRKKRKLQGALDLNSTELKFKVDKNGEPLEVSIQNQDEAEKLIEDLMITANEVVSNTFEKRHYPFIYRIHEQPHAKRMEAFMALSSRLGFSCQFSFLTVTPLQLSRHLEKISKSPRYEVLSRQLLRSLAKARYSIENKGHFGLASKCYCHFTSPIRRYPDLEVHRLIDRFLIEKHTDYDEQMINNLIKIAEVSSINERRALAIERDVIDLMSAKYMAQRIGEIHEGVIVGFTVNGMFVEMDNGIDGFIAFETMKKDFFIYDERRMMAFGKRSGKKYLLGDKCKVKVDEVDIAKATIDLSLITEKKSNKIK